MKRTLTFTATVLLMYLSGCLKPPSTVIDKGPEASCESLDNAIADIQRPSVLSIQKSEFAYIESSARIESLAPEYTQGYAVTVMDREEDQYLVKLTIREETREKIDGQFKTSIKEGPALIQKNGPTTQATASQVSRKSLGVEEIGKKLRILSGASGSQGANCASQKSGVVKSFHNLQISDFSIPVPQAVASRADCGGLANCKGPLAGKSLKFDRWITDPNNPSGEIKVTTYVLTTSEVPFFATIFSQCVQYSWPIETRQVLVTSCDDVKDFKFGVKPAL